MICLTVHPVPCHRTTWQGLCSVPDDERAWVCGRNRSWWSWRFTLETQKPQRSKNRGVWALRTFRKLSGSSLFFLLAEGLKILHESLHYIMLQETSSRTPKEPVVESLSGFCVSEHLLWQIFILTWFFFRLVFDLIIKYIIKLYL